MAIMVKLQKLAGLMVFALLRTYEYYVESTNACK